MSLNIVEYSLYIKYSSEIVIRVDIAPGESNQVENNSTENILISCKLSADNHKNVGRILPVKHHVNIYYM